jgi:glucose/arabinose dehydrogenase
VRAAFGLAFYPGTSTLLASMNQRDELGAKTPGDVLAVVRAGQDWKFPACYDQGGSACSGVPVVLATLGKHAAAGGVAVVTGQLGSTTGPAALVSEWELGTVQRVALTGSASSLSGDTPTTFLRARCSSGTGRRARSTASRALDGGSDGTVVCAAVEPVRRQRHR